MHRALVRRIRSSRPFQNAAWIFAGQGLSLFVQALYFAALARVLGSAEYGMLAGATAIVSIASQYSSMGSGLLFLRHVSVDRTLFPAYWGNILMSTFCFGSALVLLLHFAGFLIVPAANVQLLTVLAVADCLCLQLTSCISQIFQTFERMKITAALNLLTNASRMLMAILMLFLLHKATAKQWAIASLVVSIAATATAVAIVTINFGRPSFSPRVWLRRLGEGVVFAASGSTTSIYNDLDKALLAHYGMNVANGIYNMAYRVIDISTIPIRSIHAAALPRFFQRGKEGVRNTIPLASKILGRTSVLALVSAAGMYLLAPLIPVVLGKGFAGSVSALRWLCLIPLFRCFHLSAGDALAGAGFQVYRFTAQCVIAGGNLMLNLYLIPRYSWLGAAWASLVSDGSLAVLSWSLLLVLAKRSSALVSEQSLVLAD